jgi:hypothetical protein
MMDLAHGNYLALDIADARLLEHWVRGWPIPGPEQREPEVLKQLIAEGLLTQDPARGRNNPAPVSAIPPVATLLDAASGPVRVRAHHVYRFLLTVGASLLALRWWSLKRIVAHVGARKARAGAFDLDKARELIAVFEYLYPVFFGSNKACLRNSFLLLEFLARYGIFPDWVFAVRATPFLAHCWLQHQGLVLNDHMNSTACLTPIMVV